MFFLGHDNEGFESAKASTIIPSDTIAGWIAYAQHDLNLGLLRSFQIYSQDGVQVYCSIIDAIQEQDEAI